MMRLKRQSNCCGQNSCSSASCNCGKLPPDATKEASTAEEVDRLPESPKTFGGRPLILPDGKTWARPSVYVKHPNGRTTFAVTEDDPICDETLPLTDDEVSLVVLPMLTLLQFFHVDPTSDVSDDIMTRTVRGYINQIPHSHQYLNMMHEKKFSPHVCAAAEAIHRIYDWRTRVDVQANTILDRHLDGAEDFHRLWPVMVSGVDKYGHCIFSEEIHKIQTTPLMTRFTLNDIFLLRTQVQEQFQRSTYDEGKRQGVTLRKHSHVINLAGVSLIEFYRVSNRLKPLFGLLQEQYPDAVHLLFLINTPRAFRAIWAIIRLWLAYETVVRIHIWGPVNSNLVKDLNDTGIPPAELPHWAGGSNSGKSILDVINESIQSPSQANEMRFSAELQKRLESLRFPGVTMVTDAREPDEYQSPAESTTPSVSTTSKGLAGVVPWWAFLTLFTATIAVFFFVFVVSSKPLALQIKDLTSRISDILEQKCHTV